MALDPLAHTVHLPHLTDCTLFCRCDHGKPKLDRCPDGLHFNPNLQVCDWPEYAGCNSNGGEGGGESETTLSQEVTTSLITNPSQETTTSVTAELPEEDCPTIGKCPLPDPLYHTVHLPHLTNCTLFCRCDHGKPKLERCPDGLHFNPNLQVCDWPEYAGCNSTGGEGGGESETTLSQEATTSLITNPSQETTTSVTAELPEKDCPIIGKCPLLDPLDHTVHLPHLTNCTLFCRCDHGKPKLDHCPDGLHFNPNLQVCDWPEYAACNSTGGEEVGETTLSQEVTPSLRTSPEYETTTSVTAELPEEDCPTRGKCPLPDPLDHTVHLPHLTNCTLFCRCDHGKPKIYQCPDGLHFNPILQVCDWPEYAGCNSTGGEEVGETTLSQEVTPSLRTSPEHETTTSVTAELPEEDCPTRGKCPFPDPLDHTVHLPHLTNCTLFCRCDHGKPKLDRCPDGLYFNPNLQVCDWLQNAGCSSTGGEGGG
uniref:Chitin-binding type-2 domain-containing protein n=1 Tax=Timema douglasi TaxID=61478 RepID=A0A7R8VIG7_TIMDO|nr:unnamed protein product [Timema douglasi]